jgi:bilirubin oxidase
MATMNVTLLQGLGYGLEDTRLEDPVDQRFRARRYAGTDIEDVKSRVLPAFANLGAYPDGEKLAALEENYWSGHGSRR